MSERRTGGVDRLALLGIGVTILGAAVTVQPIEMPAAVPVVLYAVGAGIVILAGLLWLRKRLAVAATPTEGRRREVESIRAAAEDCEGVRATLDDVIGSVSARRRSRPGSQAQRERAALERYQLHVRPLVDALLDDIERWLLVSSTTRAAAKGQSIGQLRLLRGALTRLEQQLSRSAQDRAA